MKSNYDILNIPPDTDKSGIKKAYFRQVKSCSPEKDPEGFKELRKAYEVLMDDSAREQYDKILTAPEEYLKELHEAKRLMERLLFAKACEILKSLDKKYPGQYDIGMALSECYIETGRTNLAIKLAKALCDKHPSSQPTSLMLANAYEKRGFTQKALVEYKRAAEIEPANPVGWWQSIEFCTYNRYYYEGDQLAERALKISEDMFLGNYKLYILMFNLSTRRSDDLKIRIKYINKLIDGFLADKNVSEENITIVIETFKNITKSADYSSSIKRAIPRLEDICISKVSYLKPLEQIKGNLRFCDYLNDKKIPEILNNLTRLTLEEKDTDEDYLYHLNLNFAEEIVLSRLNLEMEILTKADSLKKAILYTQSNYPDIFSLNADFYRKALDFKNIEHTLAEYYKKLKKRLKNIPEYGNLPGNLLGKGAKKNTQVDPRNLFEAPPDNFEQPSLFDEDFGDFENFDDYEGFDDFDDFITNKSEQPYIREQPKIGRNQPCPCGSGKKYKHCCGK